MVPKEILLIFHQTNHQKMISHYPVTRFRTFLSTIQF